MLSHIYGIPGHTLGTYGDIVGHILGHIVVVRDTWDKYRDISGHMLGQILGQKQVNMNGHLAIQI